MKTIITTVGVSLFDNYQRDVEPIADLGSLEETYSDDEWAYSETLRQNITKQIVTSDWIQGNHDASAEIKSLLKIKERVGDIRTILVTSDTLKGYFAGHVLYTLLNEVFGIPAERPERIEEFDVTIAQGCAQEEGQRKIKAGFDNYIRFLLETSNTYEDSLAGYNISGGFKAMIPISTLIASLKKHPVFYIYEQSDYLIEIPPFPFIYDPDICKPFEQLFGYLEQAEYIDEQARIYQEADALAKAGKGSMEYLLTSNDPKQHHLKTFSPIGKIVWEAYKESTKAVIFTEGKTDWKHLKHAQKQLGLNLNIGFKQAEDAIGDDWLFKKCKAFAEEKQHVKHIFIFDHDKPDIVKKVMDGNRYRNWGNNVFSFAIPIPNHREGYEKVAIEMYYPDEILQTPSQEGRRLFLSSEFDKESRKHEDRPEWRVAKPSDVAQELTEPKKAKLISYERRGEGVLDEMNKQIALSKAEFVEHIREGIPPFDKVNFEPFREIFDIIEEILDTSSEKEGE